MRLLMGVVTRYEARQHTGVRRLYVPAYECQAHAGLRPHGEPPQHFDMAMAAADQDQVAFNFSGTWPHCTVGGVCIFASSVLSTATRRS